MQKVYTFKQKWNSKLYTVQYIYLASDIIFRSFYTILYSSVQRMRMDGKWSFWIDLHVLKSNSPLIMFVKCYTLLPLN
jgi:hypothetical protein